MANPSAGTLELVDTIEALDWEPDCEHSQHTKDWRRHSGKAAWIQNAPHDDCDDVMQILTCDAWKKYVRSHAAMLNCPTCNGLVLPSTITFTKL